MRATGENTLFEPEDCAFVHGILADLDIRVEWSLTCSFALTADEELGVHFVFDDKLTMETTYNSSFAIFKNRFVGDRLENLFLKIFSHIL
jgi:hypothetical protein